MICIYQIRNLENNKIYIGSTKNFNKRKLRHIRDLKKGSHHCIYLQRAYNKSFLENFIFEILEECLETELFNKEQFWIDKLNPEYNIGGVGGGDNYTNHPDKDKFYERLCKQLQECKRPGPKFKEDNPNWRGGKTFFTCPVCGVEKRTADKHKQKTCFSCYQKTRKNKKHSEETKNKIKLGRLNKGKTTKSKKCYIENVLYDSIRSASKKLDISYSTIKHRIESKNEKFKDWYFA